MSVIRVREPNPVPPRPLGSRYFRQLADFLLSTGATGRTPGLLPPTNGGRSPLVALDPPSTLRLDSIRAIGEQGLPILSDPSDPPLKLDAEDLASGAHTVHAALFLEREEIGPMEEFFAPSGLGSARVHVDARHRVSLVAEDARLDAWDALPVAKVLREREGGALRTFLDAKFHPPIRDLRAFARPDVVRRLVERSIRALDQASGAPWVDLARVELLALGNLADAAEPGVAFAQIQRCLHLLHNVPQLDYRPGTGLLGMRFAHERFGEYLCLLEDALDGGEAPSRYPTLIVVDGQSYQHLDGEFARTNGTWTWIAPPSFRSMNGLVVYFPGRAVGEIPQLKCSKVRGVAERFDNAVRGENVSAPGAAVSLPCVNGHVEHVFAMPLQVADELALSRQMEMGHGLYYR